ncbi:hypothetical protein H2201_005417 [Coniosporium apollinis]|uniref:Uncharacterized protein n=2 Tax=Coniosporium TaxID=2810619 RepID=A0ABQ9NRI7_9PEZI|nr:hypothetical protein H2199_004347 [Cladosporium sp. JES 115]KAJ9663935.1 hypothetical protein H2201_005417 [Coniosporium apollinis]
MDVITTIFMFKMIGHAVTYVMDRKANQEEADRRRKADEETRQFHEKMSQISERPSEDLEDPEKLQSQSES